MTLRDYQLDAARWLFKRRAGVVVAPAGSGKTVIAAAALDLALRARARAEPVRIGWMANTREQVQQAWSAINQFSSVATQDVRVACAAADTDWSDRQVLVVDECHHAASAVGWRGQIAKCAGARWGFTATPPEDFEQLAVLTELLGEQFVIQREHVQRCLTAATVTWLDATDDNLQPSIEAEINRVLRVRGRFWRGNPQELWGQVAWQVCVDLGIIANKARNCAAVAAATNHRPTLVLVNKVEHGEQLAELIPGAVACYSAMGAKRRREALAAFTNGSVRCLVATTLADEGLDLPNAEVLVMVSAGRSKARTEQRTGRVLRLFAGKGHANIFDFTDRYHPLAAKHARVRGEIYAALGYQQRVNNSPAICPAGASSRE